MTSDDLSGRLFPVSARHKTLEESPRLWVGFDSELFLQDRLKFSIPRKGCCAPTELRLNHHGSANDILADGIGSRGALEDRDGFLSLVCSGQVICQSS